jgi:ATP/maltotriose-dependent transcriptional regulator MalT
VINLLHTLPATVPMLARLAFWPPLITALIDDDQLDRAEHQITELVQAAAARRLGMEARVLGLRARLAAARQRADDAIDLFATALGGYGPDDPLLERTRLLHAYGRALLSQGQRNRAVPVLREARDAFASMGAGPFLERVDVDLTSAGFDRAGDDARTAKSPLDLTDRERDVAVLVAKGLTNPEVAEELYVSRKAVEYHLSNIFGKLGITSRRELRGQTFQMSS